MAEEKKAKNRITGLKVNEISFVDNPAVPGAKFVIEKRKGGEGEMPETKTCEACGSAVELEKQELTSKQGESPMDFLQRAIGHLMAVRRSLPRTVRELLMALDMAADDVVQNGSDPDTAKTYIDRAEGTEEKEARGAEERKPEEEEKAEKQECPEGMKWDPAQGKCVPEMEKKEEEEKPENQVEKKEEGEKEEKKPVEKKEEEEVKESPDPQTGVGGLDFSQEQSGAIAKLLGRYPR